MGCIQQGTSSTFQDDIKSNEYYDPREADIGKWRLQRTLRAYYILNRRSIDQI